MRPIIRYFFKGVRAILGPILLTTDWLTTPRGIKRDPTAQQQIDEQTRELALYHFPTCPFCIKTRRIIKRLSLNIETRDARKHPASRQELIDGGGELKVPCLRIEKRDASAEWLYESEDIIRYLETRFS
ncbi:MAG TPA: glutaredoxin [Gammaproteobacteria bacterium]|nr:glutaredoxin [Gammaproteobacteria bacterium]